MEIVIEELNVNHPDRDGQLNALAQVLHACVHAGASVSFILPFTVADALAFWRDKVLPGAAAGTRRVFLARNSSGQIVGTVQLDLATPPNQSHRADVLKLLVHPNARRLGIARKLMTAVERVAVAEGRTLLTLDTIAGGQAEALYRSMGYTLLGVMPRYSRNPHTPDLEPCSFFYKELAAGDNSMN